MNDALYKFPRLYVDAPFAGDVTLADGQAHYLRHVLRKAEGDTVRLFNGRDGEWTGALQHVGKRDAAVRLAAQVRPQSPRARRVHLFFTPLKKDRLDALIECAVQLDATDLHPVVTERTDVRDVKSDRLLAQMIEAAEQCERLDLPVLHPVLNLDRALAGLDYPVFAGLERSDAKPMADALVPAGDAGVLVGPPGGWTDRERDMLCETPGINAVTLGPNVLRSEVAVAAILTRFAPS